MLSSQPCYHLAFCDVSNCMLRAGNRQVLEALGLCDGGNLTSHEKEAAKVSASRVPWKRKVWPRSDRVMRDAQLLQPPTRLSPGQPGRVFSMGASYEPALEATSSLCNSGYAVSTASALSKTNFEMAESRRNESAQALGNEMAKTPVEPPGLLLAIREAEAMGVDFQQLVEARVLLRSSIPVQDHGELVRKLDAHMEANGIVSSRIYKLFYVSATSFYIWRGRTAQKITDRLMATIDECVAAYLAGVDMGIDPALAADNHAVPEEAICTSGEGTSTSHSTAACTANSICSQNRSARPNALPRVTVRPDGQRGKWFRDSSDGLLGLWRHSDYPQLEMPIPHSVPGGTRRVYLCRALEKHLRELDLDQWLTGADDVENCDSVSIVVAGGGEMTITPEMAVEVTQTEEGLRGSSYQAKIVELRCSPRNLKTAEALVEYETLFTEETDGDRAIAPEDNSGVASIINIVPGQCATPGCCLPDFHTEPCTPLRACGKRKRAATEKCAETEKRAAFSSTKLREWVKISTLTPPREPPARDWHKRLEAGDEVEMYHDGGFWQVAVHERLNGLKKGTQFKVGAVGYAVVHTVNARSLRPRVAN